MLPNSGSCRLGSFCQKELFNEILMKISMTSMTRPRCTHVISPSSCGLDPKWATTIRKGTWRLENVPVMIPAFFQLFIYSFGIYQFGV